MTFATTTIAGRRSPAVAPDPTFLDARIDRYYRGRLDRAWGGVHPMKGRIPDANSVRLRTNDYLCLAGDPRLIDAEVRALQAFGHGEAVSRIWVHHERDISHSFEKRVASIMQAESAVLCNSGYCANVGLLQSIADPETPIYIDMMAHMSLWEGVKSAGATPRSFRHNDATHLHRLATKYGPGLVIIDAVYSTDGDLCPLVDIVRVSEECGCAVVVDETHSFGTHGPSGAGLVVEHGLAHRVHFRTVGLSKAVASRGGLVVCSNRNAEFFRYEALPAIFSTSVLGHEVAGYNAVLDIFAGEPWRRDQLHANHAYLRAALDELGYNVSSSRSQIISLEAGEVRQTVKLRDALEARGIFGSLFFAPAVPDKRCLIRFTLNCDLTRAQLERVVSACADIRDEVGLADWPSTRRKRARVTDTPREVVRAAAA